MRSGRQSQLPLLGLPRPLPGLCRPQFHSQFMNEESHYQATDNKTHPATLAQISLESISSAGWWLRWDTAAGVAQAAKQASGHGQKNVPLVV